MIRNEYQVTWNLFKAWGLERALKGVQLGFAIGWIVIGLLIFIIDLSSGGNILYRALVVFCLYRALVRWLVVTKKQYRLLSRTHNGENWLRVICFDEECIRMEDGAMSVEYKYSDIVRMEEKDNDIRLIASNNTVIRLFKDCFIDSTWEECKAFIEKKQSSSME